MIRRYKPLAPGRPPMRGSPPQRSGPPRKVNPERRISEFKRCYHSKAFVKWCQRQRCYACGADGPCDVAHVEGGGAGRKANWNRTAPLCSGINGCHRIQHQRGWFEGLGMTEEARDRAAKLTEAAFLDYLHRGIDDDADFPSPDGAEDP